MTDWTGRGVIVSGGSRGIGLEVAALFAERGAQVAICSRSVANLDRAAAEIEARAGTRPLTLVADFRRRADIDGAVAAAAAGLGRIDVLVNNAGVTPFGIFAESTDDEWQETFDLKLFGAVRATRAALPHLLRYGKGAIVNVVGTSSVEATAGMSANGAACAALAHLTKGLALELGPLGLRVNAVSPGSTDTERWQQAIEALAGTAGTSEAEVQAAIAAAHPLRRLAHPREPAEVVVFVASDEASYLNGANVIVDGGLTPGV